MTTLDQIRKVSARVARAEARLQQEREVRDELIRQALAEGWSHAQIARAAEVTRGRVGQLAAGLR